MTRQEAIETVNQVMVERNRKPRNLGAELNLAEFLIASLIALEILKVDDDKR